MTESTLTREKLLENTIRLVAFFLPLLTIEQFVFKFCKLPERKLTDRERDFFERHRQSIIERCDEAIAKSE